ncbi:MAG: hypothetical protein ACLTDS_04070 [Bianqueaceae bacterium]
MAKREVIYISIHVPKRDDLLSRLCVARYFISIHVPARGTTRKLVALPVFQFQSTSPARGTTSPRRRKDEKR